MLSWLEWGVVKAFSFQVYQYIAMKKPLIKDKINKMMFIIYKYPLLPCFKAKSFT